MSWVTSLAVYLKASILLSLAFVELLVCLAIRAPPPPFSSVKGLKTERRADMREEKSLLAGFFRLARLSWTM